MVVQKVQSFIQILDLAHISHICMSFTGTEIKTEIWISFFIDLLKVIVLL